MRGWVITVPKIVRPWRGLITGWVGNMGSEKTSRLILKAKDQRKQRSGVEVFQPILGRRGLPGQILTRSGLIYEGAYDYDKPQEILVHLGERKIKHLFFDEPQFNDICPDRRAAFQQVIRQLSAVGHHNIYWAALPRDCFGETFETVGWLLGITDVLHKLETECDQCDQSPAPFPQRLRHGLPVSRSDPRFIPDTDKSQKQGVTYEARCVRCYEVAEDLD